MKYKYYILTQGKRLLDNSITARNIYYRLNDKNQLEVYSHRTKTWQRSVYTRKEIFIKRSTLGSTSVKEVSPELRSCRICKNDGCPKCKTNPFSVWTKFNEN